MYLGVPVCVCVCLVWKRSETCVLDPRLNTGWISFVRVSPLRFPGPFANFTRYTEFDGWIWMMGMPIGRYADLKLQLDRKQCDWFYLHKRGTTGLTLRCGRIINEKSKRAGIASITMRSVQRNAEFHSKFPSKDYTEVCATETNQLHARYLRYGNECIAMPPVNLPSLWN